MICQTAELVIQVILLFLPFGHNSSFPRQVISPYVSISCETILQWQWTMMTFFGYVTLPMAISIPSPYFHPSVGVWRFISAIRLSSAVYGKDLIPWWRLHADTSQNVFHSFLFLSTRYSFLLRFTGPHRICSPLWVEEPWGIFCFRNWFPSFFWHLRYQTKYLFVYSYNIPL